MKMRILIGMHYMEIGGAESSLVGLLEALDPERVEVDLFVYSHRGVFMSEIPEWVNLLPEVGEYAMMERPLVEAAKAGYFRVVMARLRAKMTARRNSGKRKVNGAGKEDISIFGYVGEEMTKVVPDVNPAVEYDLAISYLTPHNFVLDHVRAKRKVAWIHTDYSKVYVDGERELKVWSGYDRIVSISPDVTKGYVTVFPELAGRIVEMENVLPVDYIMRKASAEVQTEGYRQEGRLTLCSVGRIGYAKNYDNVPLMAAELKRMMGDGFRWYIVGPGDHSDIDRLSKDMGVEDNVVFLGASDNPYPYIRACDIYVHPSRYEGKSVVVREAQVLRKPVIITDYPTARSQVRDGVDGVVCAMDNKAVAEAIYCLANDRERRERIVEYLRSHDFSGKSEVEKVYGRLRD